jgi:hypothetical protein
MAELITGRELCDLFRIEYESIVRHRWKDQQANLEYIAHELLAIEGIRQVVLGRIEASGATPLSSVDVGRHGDAAEISTSTTTATSTPDQLGI